MISKAIIVGTVTKKIYGKSKNDVDYMTLTIVTHRGVRSKEGITYREAPSVHYVNVYAKMAEMVDAEIEEQDLVYVEGYIQHNVVHTNPETWLYRIKAEEVRKIVSQQDVNNEL